MKTDKLLQVLTQGPQKAQGRLLPLPKAQTGRNILVVDPDDPEGMARYKAAQDSAAAYNSPFQALKALETWQKNPTEENAEKYREARRATYEWAASPSWSKDERAKGFKSETKDTPDNTPDGNKDFINYYEKPVQQVVLRRPDVKPMTPIGFSEYESQLQQREGVTPQMLSGIDETIMMPSGVEISKKDFIKQYGQGAWDRATNKKKGGPLLKAQKGLPKGRDAMVESINENHVPPRIVKTVELPTVDIVADKGYTSNPLAQTIRNAFIESRKPKSLNTDYITSSRDETNVDPSYIFNRAPEGYFPEPTMIDRVLYPLDVISDVAQLGNFIPEPTAQLIGKAGLILGSGVDAFQAGQNHARGQYGDMAWNLGASALAGALGAKGYTRDMWNTVPGTLENRIANLGSRSGEYMPLISYPRLAGNPVIRTGLNFNKAALGTLGAETIYDAVPQRKTGGPTDKLLTVLTKHQGTGSSQTGDKTVSQIWEAVTGTNWSKAKELGFTDGSYSSNVDLKNKLLSGDFGKRETPVASAPVRPAQIVNPAAAGEQPIRTIMDPRYQQQSSPVPYFPSLNTGLNQDQSAQQPNLILNPDWKEGDDPNTRWMIDLPTVEGETLYSFPTCIGGLCYDMASDLGQGIDQFKKRNNVIGNAWNIIDTAFGENIDYNPKDFTNLKVGDIVALTRGKRATDRERGITSESEQHMGRISKIVDGVPYVKHYMPGIEGKGTKDNTEKSYGRYLEEPINKIGEVTKYTPSRVKRLPDYKELNLQPSTFNFDQNYKPNQIEQQMLTAMKEKPFLQETLALDNDEYDNLEKLAYGILYNEGKFGRSEKTLYRMAAPDFVQKLVKQGHDMLRGTDIYDENINNLSQGYGSIKESTLHGVSQTDINEDKSNKLSSEEVNRRVKQGDFSNLERTNNYLYEAMREMGLNPDNLENGGNSFKAVMATLAWYKKRFPNATDDQLMQKFLGKKNITKYKNNMENAYRNIDRNVSNNQEYSFMDELYGKASGAFNTAYEGLKDVRSNVVSTARDYSGMPLMVKGIVGDVLGGKEPITNTTLSSDQMDALTNIVRNQVNSGKNYLDYNAYFPDLSRGERLEVSGGVGDEGGGSSNTEKLARAMSPEGQLQNTFGQASIVPLGNNRYMVTDTYDFNDQGKSFGLIDDLKRRGPDPYSIARSIGRNYGSMDEQGAPVRIIVDLNEKKQGGSYTPKKTLKVRIKKPK